MQPSSPSYRWAVVAFFLSLGCQPSIGDSCSTNTDCSLTGARLCDPTSPGGYCTQFNCSPGTCPDEAACVGFYDKLASECSGPVSDQRFERSFCMKKCTSDSDCRNADGYACLDPAGDLGVSAAVLESGDAAQTRVCMVRPPAVPDAGSAMSGEPAICTVHPADAGMSLPPDASAKKDGAPPADARASDARLDADAGSRTGAEGGKDAGREGGRDGGGDAGDARVAP